MGGVEGQHIITDIGKDITTATNGIKGYLEKKQPEVEDDYKKKTLRKQKQKKRS